MLPLSERKPAGQNIFEKPDVSYIYITNYFRLE